MNTKGMFNIIEGGLQLVKLDDDKKIFYIVIF